MDMCVQTQDSEAEQHEVHDERRLDAPRGTTIKGSRPCSSENEDLRRRPRGRAAAGSAESPATTSSARGECPLGRLYAPPPRIEGEARFRDRARHGPLASFVPCPCPNSFSSPDRPCCPEIERVAEIIRQRRSLTSFTPQTPLRALGQAACEVGGKCGSAFARDCRHGTQGPDRRRHAL
jgi:hypothetical protein